MRPVDRRRFLQGSLAALAAPGALGASRALAATPPRLRELERAVRGQVLTPASAGYDAARVVYNERFDGIRPLAVVRCAGAEDVRQAVRWCARNGVPVAARSGGHSYAGYSTTGGVVVDLRGLNAIALDRPSRTATVGAGASLIDVYSRLAAAGVTIPAGSCATVGVAGLALGGGVGFASRKLGTTSDNVVSVRIVTADGRVLDCDRRRNPDLYWACRGGGGGNFGIVTSFRLRVHTVSRAAYFFARWPWEDAAGVVAAWQAFAPHAPDELFSVCSLSTAQSAPTVTSAGQLFGSESALRSLIRPLSRVGQVSLSTGTDDYLSLMLRWAGCLHFTVDQCHLQGATVHGQLERATFGAKSDYVARPLPAAGIKTALGWIEQRQAQSSLGSGALLFDSYGGAINRVPPAATAFAHRDELFSCQYLAYWGGEAAASASLGWLNGFHQAMRPYVSGAAYLNYIDPDLAGWQAAYYGSNYARLLEVKRRYDPDGLFRFRQSIGARG